MSQKVRKTLIMIVMAALIICLMAASLTYTFTYGRYAGGKFNSTESPYDDLIEFVGAREYTVRSPEELIQAIKDGYSNIVIAEDAEEPFVITEGVTDVEANLVLNLNGKVVVRNSRNPMLDVQTNVSVVLVYDSKNTGAFYNPVGSSLMASGGSLTVGSGGYESGPRAEEYEGKESAGELGSDTAVTLFARSKETNEGTSPVTSPVDLDRSQYVSGYSLVSGVPSLPEIEPEIKRDVDGNVETVRGNVYLNSGHGDWLPADTFLIYTVEENCFIGDGTSSGGVTFESGKLYVDAESETVGDDTIITASEFTTPLCNVASCDFYYYYPISGTAGTDENPQDYAVIYGYWDVMKLARDDKKNETDEKGMATALKDSGLIYPYGAVRMVEGEGIVRGGTFNNHFDAVNTYGIYAEGGTLSVSKNTKVDTTFTTGGEGVCIRVQSAMGEATTTGETTTTGGSLTISGGSFSSEIGNTIEISGGKMTVTKGTFKKSGGKGIGSGGNDQVANQTAMIDMQGGKLNVSGTKTDDTYSVTMTAGGTDNGDTLTNVFGILAHGGGEVSVGGCTFNINGNYSAGVLSYDGTINLNDNTAITVTQSDEHKQDGKTLLTSAGVSSERDTSATSTSTEPHPINMSGNVQITSNGLGITARGNINIKEADDDQSATQVQVETTRATGIYVNGGTFKVERRAQISVKSTVSADYAWGLPPEGIGTSPNIYNGVYVENGSIDASEGTLNVTFTGVQNDARNASGNDQIAYNGENTSFLNQQTKSYAVRVEAGTGTTTVTIASGEIKNSVGGGVLVNGGTVHLGGYVDKNGTAHTSPNPVTVQTTGTEVNTSKIYINGMADNWAYYWNMKGGDAVKVDGGELYVYDGTYAAAQGNGILTRDGTANIYKGTFTGGYNSTHHATTGAASTYSFKAYGGTVNIFGGDFDSDAEGAFVMGTSASDMVTITGGSFQAQGPTAFATWNGATVEFDDSNSENKITVSGESTGLTVEQVSSGWSSQKITIKSATFKSTNQNESNKNGIWYGNGNAKLTISGGSFTGTTGSGLRIDANPGNNIQLSGGTYNGSNGAINGSNNGSNIRLQNILGADARCGTGRPTDTRGTAICTWTGSWPIYNYTQVGKENGNFTLNDNQVCVNEGDRTRFREFGQVVIDTGELFTFET